LRNRNRTHPFFRCTENSSAAAAGNVTPIVHTAFAFMRRLTKLPHKETARASARNVREKR
jgi:hypothetical protein